jgi:hypothetical protein
MRCPVSHLCQGTCDALRCARLPPREEGAARHVVLYQLTYLNSGVIRERKVRRTMLRQLNMCDVHVDTVIL